MSKKATLHLSIDTSLVELAKNSNLNLSAEFEEWIKIRLGNISEDKPFIDVDKEIAKHQVEIQKLKSQVEIIKTEEMKKQEEVIVVDDMIDKMVKELNEILNNPTTIRKNIKTLNDLIDSKIHGVQFLFQKKFKKILNPLQTKELLENRLKERKLIK